jgi:hypothetical protein
MTKTEAMEVLKRNGLDTHAKAKARSVEIMVKRWGEAERSHAEKDANRRSHGILCNSIAVHNLDALDPELREAVKAILTPEDRAFLRQGG